MDQDNGTKHWHAQSPSRVQRAARSPIVLLVAASTGYVADSLGHIFIANYVAS